MKSSLKRIIPIGDRLKLVILSTSLGGGMVSSTALTLIVIPAIYAAIKGAWLPKACPHPPALAAAAPHALGESL